MVSSPDAPNVAAPIPRHSGTPTHSFPSPIPQPNIILTWSEKVKRKIRQWLNVPSFEVTIIPSPNVRERPAKFCIGNDMNTRKNHWLEYSVSLFLIFFWLAFLLKELFTGRLVLGFNPGGLLGAYLLWVILVACIYSSPGEGMLHKAVIVLGSPLLLPYFILSLAAYHYFLQEWSLRRHLRRAGRLIPPRRTRCSLFPRRHDPPRPRRLQSQPHPPLVDARRRTRPRSRSAARLLPRRHLRGEPPEELHLAHLRPLGLGTLREP